jgi:DNA-binding transcriptional LysR family regulator
MTLRQPAINLRQLSVFCAVAARMSVSAAAEDLMMSQPAVSQQLRALEHQLGAKLFEWTGQRLLLTEVGAAVRPHAEAMLALADEIALAVAELRLPADRGALSLGANTTGGMYIVPELVRGFLAEHPHAQVTLQVEHTNRIVDRILQGFVDVALVTGPLVDERLAIRDVASDELVTIASPAHPLAARTSVSVAEVAAAGWVLYAHGSRTREVVRGAFAQRGHKLNVVMQLSSTEAVKKAVESNLGIAMVSGHAVARELALGALVALSVEGLSIRRPIHLLHRGQRRLTPLAASFCAFVSARAGGQAAVGEAPPSL